MKALAVQLRARVEVTLLVVALVLLAAGGLLYSPEFFLDGQGWYCPSLHIEKVGNALRIQPDIESLQAFLAACFG